MIKLYINIPLLRPASLVLETTCLQKSQTCIQKSMSWKSLASYSSSYFWSATLVKSRGFGVCDSKRMIF